MTAVGQIESPDGRELQRAWCPEGCGYSVATAIWCHDSACCDQSPEGFIDGLVPAETARGIPVFAVRYLGPAAPGTPVRIWRAGNLTPVCTAPLACAVQFEMQHDCPGAKAS
jgi:hypothetical protein